MLRILGCGLLMSVLGFTQSLDSTLLALKDSSAPRSVLSKQLADQMLVLAKANQSPARATVQRFSDDLTTALLGRDITAVRAAALAKAVTNVMSGKGPTFVPATSLRETLAGCGIDPATVQGIVRRFIDIGQEVRGPDDMPLRNRLKP